MGPYAIVSGGEIVQRMTVFFTARQHDGRWLGETRLIGTGSDL
jgi:hypothetical protein